MPECAKAYYLDQASARVALAAIREKAAQTVHRKLPVRVYPCDVCDGWHLTASPVRGRTPPWDRDPDWTRPAGQNHLQPRSRDVSKKQNKAAARNNGG